MAERRPMTHDEVATMQTLRTLARADAQGILHLDIRAGAPDSEYEVVVVLQPKAADSRPVTPEALGWPPQFFEQTSGAWQGDLVRDQGRFEERDEL